MYHIAVVDDEQQCCDQIVDFLTRYAAEQNIQFQISCYHSGMQFLENYSPTFQLVFLDIDMPEMGGMQTARELRLLDEEIGIIFVTNLARYAIRGYEVNALDFILKPVQYTSFSYKLGKALRLISRFHSDKCIFLPFDGLTKKVALSEIYYVESESSYVIYHTVFGDCRTRGPLKNIEAQFAQDGFLSCNHSFLVNLKYVTDLNNDTVTVGGAKLKISRNKKKAFLNGLTAYLGRSL